MKVVLHDKTQKAQKKSRVLRWLDVVLAFTYQ